MIRTVRNPMLGSASFWTENLSIIGFKTKTLSELVSDMFKNGEQGFFYDPSSLTYGTYGVDQTSVGVPVTVGVADAAEYDNTLHTGIVYRADQYNQSIVNFDVDNTKSHELIIENTGATTIAVNADLAMGSVLFTVAAGQRVTRLIDPVQVIVITSANNVSTATFKIHSLREISGGMYIMYQDAVGTVPVTAAGQPVGLILDKSKGLVLGSQLINNGTFDTDTVWNKGNGWSISGGKARFDGSASFSILGTVISTSINSKFLKVEFELSNVGASVTQIRVLVSGNLGVTVPVSGSGKYSAIVLGGVTPSIGIQSQFATGAGYAFSLDNVSIKELFGNHAYQTTSSMRPLLAASPQRLDYDTVDDKLITTLPAQLTGCTVVRAVPNVGTQILTNQTIPTPYNDNTDHCGLIVINRALTATEASQITKLFNKAAGV